MASRNTMDGDTVSSRSTPGDVGPQGALVTPNDPRKQVVSKLLPTTSDMRGTVSPSPGRGGGMLGGYGFNEDVDPATRRGGNTRGLTGGVAPAGRVAAALSRSPRNAVDQTA